MTSSATKTVPETPTSEMVEAGALRNGEYERCETVQDQYDLFRKQWARALAAAQPNEPPVDLLSRTRELLDELGFAVTDDETKAIAAFAAQVRAEGRREGLESARLTQDECFSPKEE